MDNTIIQQGNFTSTGAATVLQLRNGTDWIEVYNITQAAASQTTAVGVKYYWQNGFPQGAKWTTFKSNAANAANLEQYITTNGFLLLDSSTNPVGLLSSTITAISNATIPVVSATGITLAAGSVVRLINVASAQQLGGMDFTVGYNTNTTGTFSLDYMSTIVAGTTGSFRQILFDPLFYPTRRFITKITQATQAVVTLSVTHGYQVGQSVRMVVPAAFGMVEMNGLLGDIVAINTNTSSGNTITLDINSSGFTAFAFPLSAAVPFTFAEVVPVGEDTALALSSNVSTLTDATVNTGYIGMYLTGGVNNPGGASSDVIYWKAGSSFSNNGM